MKEAENIYENFVYFILPLIIIFLGLIGNLLGLITLFKRQQLQNKEIGPINLYRYIFITDSIIILSFIQVCLDKIYSTGFLLFSIYSCKIIYYFVFSFCSSSSFLLIFILIERYLSIKYPVESNLLRNNKTQFIYLITIFIINLIYWSPVFIYFNIFEIETNKTNETILMCTIEQNEKYKIEIITFLNRIILPLFLILFFSILLICNIYKSTRRMSTFYSQRERNTFKRDVQLSIISILFNLIQYSLYIPLIIIYFIFNDNQSSYFFLCFNVFYLGYAFNFYFLIMVNSLFRKEFYSIFTKKRSNTDKLVEMEVICRKT